MFEPKAFHEPSFAQMELMEALQRRDLPRFEALLASPNVDPDHWYGKPYWSTCLAVACRERDCEPFILALLRAGAGTTKRGVSLCNSSDADSSAPGSFHGPRRNTESQCGPPFLVEPSVLKSTVELAMNKEKQVSKADEVLQTVRDMCLQMEDFKERIGNDVHACLQQIERFELHLNNIEQAQRRNNNMLIQVMEMLSSKSNQKAS